MLQVLLLVFLVVLEGTDSKPVLSPVDQCISVIREKIAGKNVSRSLGGIVGVGWDDLTNTITLPILSITYKNCLTVPDGNFLIPDNVIAIPKKSVTISKSSSTFDSFSSVQSTESESISTSAGGSFMGFGASASFSMDMQQAKSHMSKSTQTMVQKKIEFYAFDMIATETHGFDESFINRLIEIANAVKDNNILLGQYKAESLINDYGTHVINKAQAGARVILRTFVTFNSEESKQKYSKNITASVSAEGFGIKASVGGGGGNTAENEASSSSYTRETFIITKGGPDIDRLLSANENDDMLKMDSLVGLKEEGLYLYSMIHPGVLDGYDELQMQIVHGLIYNATVEYYNHNTIPGCTNATSVNYNYRANVEDGSCGSESEIHAFGGAFRNCEYVSTFSEINPNELHGTGCDEYTSFNPFTEQLYDCPEGYKKMPVQSFYKISTDRKRNITKSDCNFPKSIFGCKDTVVEYPITDQIKITSYWCQSEISIKSHDFNQIAMFGGIFEVDNIFSDDIGCPVGFSAYPFLHSLKICMGRYNPELATNAVAFGGTIHCRDFIQECGKGYSKYLAATIDGCPYHYCARVLNSKGLSTLPKLSRPPYIDRSIAMSQTRSKYVERMNELNSKAKEALKQQNKSQ